MAPGWAGGQIAGLARQFSDKCERPGAQAGAFSANSVILVYWSSRCQGADSNCRLHDFQSAAIHVQSSTTVSPAASVRTFLPRRSATVGRRPPDRASKGHQIAHHPMTALPQPRLLGCGLGCELGYGRDPDCITRPATQNTIKGEVADRTAAAEDGSQKGPAGWGRNDVVAAVERSRESREPERRQRRRPMQAHRLPGGLGLLACASALVGAASRSRMPRGSGHVPRARRRPEVLAPMPLPPSEPVAKPPDGRHAVDMRGGGGMLGNVRHIPPRGRACAARPAAWQGITATGGGNPKRRIPPLLALLVALDRPGTYSPA